MKDDLHIQSKMQNIYFKAIRDTFWNIFYLLTWIFEIFVTKINLVPIDCNPIQSIATQLQTQVSAGHVNGSTRNGRRNTNRLSAERLEMVLTEIENCSEDATYV